MKIDNKMTVTTWIIIITAIVWLVWDLYAYFNDMSTFSQEITAFGYYSPIAPFIMGLLIGHWFWTTEVKRD